MFEGIDGAGVFLGVGEAAVSEDAGYGLDVGTGAVLMLAPVLNRLVPQLRQCGRDGSDCRRSLYSWHDTQPSGPDSLSRLLPSSVGSRACPL